MSSGKLTIVTWKLSVVLKSAIEISRSRAQQHRPDTEEGKELVRDLSSSRRVG